MHNHPAMNPTCAAGAASPTAEAKALMGLARLMTLAFEGLDLAPLASELIERAGADQQDADALMDLSTILQLQGVRDLGITTQAHALQTKRLYELRGRREPVIRLLAIMAPGDLMTNTPLEFLIEDSDISLRMLYLLPEEPIPRELPAHDVLFIAVSQSDRTRPLLEQLAAVAPSWGNPVVNRPDRITNTSRTRAFELLDGVAGVFMPATARASRAELQQISTAALQLGDVLSDGAFPLIVRPVDSHAGHDLAKLDDAKDIEAYLRATAGDKFFISRFIDYRGEDGLFRKYRIVLIDGVAYAGHMGVSEHWMIHYLNAGMADSARKRAEEEAFMRDFEIDFARRHAEALRLVAERFELDYLVLDCGETEAGELLMFEVCTGAVVHAMDPVDVFAYKRPHMMKVFAAFRSLLSRAMRRYGDSAPVV
jgi:glutathione synthase/RimK-type ligase-like ATP-grasp enzyme